MKPLNSVVNLILKHFDGLNQYIKSIHGQIGEYSCSHCDYEARSETTLTIRMKMIHR